MNGCENRKAKSGQRRALKLFAFSFSLIAFSCPSWASSTVYYDYLRGLVEEQAGNNAKALEAYKKVIAQDPAALEVYRDIAQLNLRTGQTQAALEAAEKVRDLAPKDPDSFLFLGNVYVADGNLAKAAEAYEEALKLDPGNLRALENLGNYYSILDPLKAFSYYQSYLTQDPNDAEIHFQIGLLQQKSGKLTDAEASFKKSADLDAQQVAPHLALAELYETQSSTAQAIAEYNQCAAIEPQNPTIFLRLGHLYYDNGQWDGAYQAFQNARALQPQEPIIYYWLARVCEELKHWAEAAGHAEKAYDLSHDPQFLPLTAYYLTLDHRLPEAVRWLEKARKVDPENPNVLLFLGMDYVDLDKPDKALEVLTKGVALYPKDPQLRFQLGVTEDRLKHLDEAVKQFQAVLEIDPKNSAAMNYLGYSWADRGVNLEEAEKLLRQAVVLDPDNGAYLDSLGWVRYKRGDRKEAISLLEQAIKETPDPEIYDHLGDVYLADQNTAKALDAWTKALAMDPTNKVIRKKADEATTHVLPGTDQRKYLKYIEGNMRQVSGLRGLVSIQGRWRKNPIKSEGQVYYERPDHLVVDVNGPNQAPFLRLKVHGQAVQIEPPGVADGLKTLPTDSLVTLSQFLSGDLTAPLDSADVRTQVENNAVHYTGPSQEAWVDTARGLLTRFIRQNPEGGQDEIDIDSYTAVDGLWLPAEMHLSNKAKRWNAHLAFSQWAVNPPDNNPPAFPSTDDARSGARQN